MDFTSPPSKRFLLGLSTFNVSLPARFHGQSASGDSVNSVEN